MVETNTQEGDETDDTCEGATGGQERVHAFMLHVHSTNTDNTHSTYKVTVGIEDVPITMEIDTGSSVTLITKTDFLKTHNTCDSLKQPSVVLKGYGGTSIKCIGEKEMRVKMGHQEERFTVRVVDTAGPSLLGRDIMSKFTLPWQMIFKVNTEEQDIIKQYPKLFVGGVGKLRGSQVTLHVKNDNPVFQKARPVPFAIREKYEAALNKLVEEDIIEKVTHSHWASPVVPVTKPDGSLRMCADYSGTINKFCDADQHPIPSLEDLLDKVAGGKKFTKLDLSQAYHQLELDTESRQFTTINTVKGLFQYKRLPYGVNAAAQLFQRTIETVLANCKGSVAYMDDVLITGGTDEEHQENVHAVLRTLQDKGLKLKKDKFRYMMEEVEYLGYKISAAGISPSPEKVKAVNAFSAPKNKAELQSFIGLANFLRRFIPKFAEIMAPLYSLLKKDTRWKWTDREDRAFKVIQLKISEQTTLQHYRSKDKLVLQTDASPVGVGAVLLQPTEEGKLMPVYFASRVLQPAERNYSQIDREALAVIFGVTKFRQYLLGRHFILMTDHKPLVILFDPQKQVPQLASVRVKRWALLLAAYDYEIRHISGRDNAAADFLSRRPAPGRPSAEEQVSVQVLLVGDEKIINSAVVRQETARDPVLSRVLYYTKNGWQGKPDPRLEPYFSKQQEITVEDDILMWDSRVIVPQSLQELLLKDLHAEHQGMVRMKQLARRYMWWKNIDRDIEQAVRACNRCQENAKMPPESAPASWSWPTGQWKRLHLDFAGPFLGKMFLVVVDAYSKFLDIVQMNQATSATTIQALRRLFSFFGLPEHIVTDNGSQFTSDEFQTFMKQNDILHTTTAPGHPATNGLAERYVGHFKDAMKKMGSDAEPLQVKLDRFLLTYRTTPNASGRTPAELLMNRQPRIRFAALRTSQTQQQVRNFEQNLNHTPVFSEGQTVFALNFGKGARWIPGTVIKVHSPMNYDDVQVGDVVWKRHRDQLRRRHIPTTLLQTLFQNDTQKPHDFSETLPRPVAATAEHAIHETLQNLSPWVTAEESGSMRRGSDTCTASQEHGNPQDNKDITPTKTTPVKRPANPQYGKNTPKILSACTLVKHPTKIIRPTRIITKPERLLEII